MIKVLLVILLLCSNLAFAEAGNFSDIKSMEDVRNIDRIVKLQKDLDTTTNKSMHSLKDRAIPEGTYFGKNYSFCDFDNTDISGCVFKRCNFSLSINIDKAITDVKTEFIGCNFSGADLPKMKTEKCNTTRFTDKDIEDMFSEENIISNISK